MLMRHIYLLIAALPSSPAPYWCTRSQPRKIFDADCTTSYVLNSGSMNRISPNFYKVYRNDWWLLCWYQNFDLPIRFETPTWRMTIVVKLRANRGKIIRFNSVNSELTGQKFKFGHDIAWLLPWTFWKWIYDCPIRCRMPKQRVKIIPCDVCEHFPYLTGCHSNVHWATAKRIYGKLSPLIRLLNL